VQFSRVDYNFCLHRFFSRVSSKQVPLISTSSQRQRKDVKRVCFASLDKHWLEEFVLQITDLNDREFSIAKQKSNSIQELETPGLHRESKSDLLTENSIFFWFAWIRKKTNSDSEYGFRSCSNPYETRFVGTHQHVTGAEDPSRIENNINIYTQQNQLITCECWTTIADVAGRLYGDRDVPGSHLDTVSKTCFFLEIDSFGNCLNFQNARAIMLQKWLKSRQEHLHVSRYRGKVRTRDSWAWDTSCYQLDHWCSIILLSAYIMLCIYSMFHRTILLQWKWMQLNEH